MGGVLSRAKLLWSGIKHLHDLSKSLEEVLERASQPPGLPVADPTAPYWLDDPPYPELVDMRSAELPGEADIVIIGSGITGAAVARSVLQECERTGVARRIVVLEARTLCSGATGRNGGHMKSSPHELFSRSAKAFGPERAAAITRFQLSHVPVLTELCRAEGWDIAECREVLTTDMFLDAEGRDFSFAEVEELRMWVPELEVDTLDAAAAREKFETNEFVIGAISYTAGALWPYRFVASVWKDLLAKFGGSLSLETGTAVTAIAAAGVTGDYAYNVVTTRGTIKCSHVVHATNAFASQFVPGLQGKMTGFLAHMSAQRPGKRFPDVGGSRSWSVVYGKSAYDYVTQRPTVDGVPGDVMLGGGLSRGGDQGLRAIGIWDDSSAQVDPLVVSHIGSIFPTVFEPKWGDDQEGGRIKRYWTGIVAATGDMLPFVGRLDPALTRRQPKRAKTTGSVPAGEWIAAGYCGDGMVWAWLSGTALGVMLMGNEREKLPAVPGRPGGRVEGWLPHELAPSPQRIKKADLSRLAGLLM